MYLTTGSDASMHVAAEAAPLRRLCDVHFEPFGGSALMAVYASRSQAESVAAACKTPQFSKGAKLHIAVDGAVVKFFVVRDALCAIPF
jgi:predicted RNA methylase